MSWNATDEAALNALLKKKKQNERPSPPPQEIIPPTPPQTQPPQQNFGSNWYSSDIRDDSHFKRAAAAKKTEEGIFESKAEAYTVSHILEFLGNIYGNFRLLMFARLIKRLCGTAVRRSFR